ncbi:P22 phage major capsid protein family protein [Deinococcus peraridilitoris]|uniref:p22 coat protein-gene protein 5 n=1 Tax=Deinococcus peraridilitoris (strain DSM 19664 / LMG 22246 / CIP 109416 / KR-200) TaxID=937777 RepID=L0A147_DEIPD|nr:P22 phage major capsid protein family protein [Deinococcus peraridilitoris]AFZ67566.1 P22 coat protein - gene protein 5 [Deinococcus peraridilitoris DSM 19664]
MTIANFKPTIWSARLQANLNKNLVLANLVNMDYSGDVTPGGTVKIQRPGRIAVSAYAGSVSYETPTSSTQTLTIDQDQYYAFAIDDLDQVQANVTLIDKYTSEAAYALADKVDQSIASLYTAAGLTDIALTLSTGDYYDALVEAGKKLDEANVPRQGRWHVTSPAGYAALLKNDKFIHATQSGDSVISSGEVGRAAGFTIIVSNNLVDADGTAAVARKALYGTNGAVTHARQLTGNPEALRLEASFKDAVRGRLAWGSKVIEPSMLGTITLTE